MEKKTDRSMKKFTSRMQARLLLVFCIVTLFLFGLMGRLIYIVQTNGDKYSKQVLSRQTYVSKLLPYKRGEILDTNGTVLAKSVLHYRLILDPELLLENEDCITATTQALKKNFNIDADSITSILKDKNKADSHYTIVQKNLKYDVVKNFEAEQKKNRKIVGISFEEEYLRTYPYNTLACDVLGFANTNNIGFYGLEEYYNNELNGTNGREYGYYDSKLDIDHIVKKAVNGNSVITTINADVQRIIQEKIIEFNKEYGSKNIGILVMNPNDGSVIAMSANRDYNPNKPSSLKEFYSESKLASMTEKQKTRALQKIWKNDSIGWLYEPGSTFKPVTVSSALEENLVSDRSSFLCDGGETINGVHIACSHVHGEITLGESIMYSCNDTMMQISRLEGKNLFYKYERNFGFGQKTGIDLPGEEAGIIIPAERLGNVELATSSFGQSTTTTMIQLASAFSSIVNGGNYYQPHVMKKIVNDSGSTVKEYEKVLVKKTISEKTSNLLKKYLYNTVKSGTAIGAKVKGYSIGGKTGTAEKFPRGTDARVVSFIGCAPAMNPQMVIYVVIDEPQKVEKQTSGIATEFAGKVLKEILPVLGIYPDGDIDYMVPTATPTPTPAPNASKKSKNKKTTDTPIVDKSKFTEE